MASVGSQALPCNSCVTLGKLLSSSESSDSFATWGKGALLLRVSNIVRKPTGVPRADTGEAHFGT